MIKKRERYSDIFNNKIKKNDQKEDRYVVTSLKAQTKRNDRERERFFKTQTKRY
jgi:hypothetical protein